MKCRKAKTGPLSEEQIKELRRMARRGGIYEESPIKQAQIEEQDHVETSADEVQVVEQAPAETSADELQVFEQAPAETSADELQVSGDAGTDVVATNATGEFFFL